MCAGLRDHVPSARAAYHVRDPVAAGKQRVKPLNDRHARAWRLRRPKHVMHGAEPRQERVDQDLAADFDNRIGR